LVFEDVLGGLRVPYLAAIYADAPVIAVWHQLNAVIYNAQFGSTAGRLLSTFERLLIGVYNRNAKLILTPTESSRNMLASVFDESKIVVMPLFISSDFVESAINWRRRHEEKQNRVVFLGKLRRYKGAHDVIEAGRIVADRITNVRFIIAGNLSEYDRSYPAELRKLSVDLGISQNVDIYTDISEEMKIELLTVSKILVVPSPVEGFGYVVLEANLCGTPVIGTDGVPSEVLVSGINGLVYKKHDTADLANKIIYLLEHPDLYSKLSKSSVQWAKEFTIERTRERMRMLYDQASVPAEQG
jgi:glycosyltransferase involved in cell wall biosynthesis